MYLIADSGSTKASWVLVHHGAIIEEFSTPGFNPHFHEDSFVQEELKKVALLTNYQANISEVYFFGAGCSGQVYNDKIRHALKKVFVAAEIHVDHDIMAAALATCGDEEGISCILGTGSNACYYDGKVAHKSNFGLGYIMGDEGSGSYYGKKLISHYLYGMLPEVTKQAFEKNYSMDKDTMIRHVYLSKGANVWLASFAKFFTERRQDSWILNTVKKGMDEFFETHVCNFKDYKNLKVHFVGSIAHFFENILRESAREKEIVVGKVLRHPIHGLAEYYLKKFPDR
jgi:N-acetylglucosamine kinase-like BadF-type ATPase